MLVLRSISLRMIVAITLVAAGSCAFIAGFGMWQQQAIVDIALEREARAGYANVMAAIDAETRANLILSNVLASMKPVKDVIAARDRAGTVALLRESQQRVIPLGIEIFGIHIAPAVNFVRVHKPESFGDDMSGRRQMVLQSIANRKVLGGIEVGFTDLSIFGATPMIDADNNVIGVIDIGSPFGKTFVTAMKARFGFDVAIHQLDGQSAKTLASTLAGGTADVGAIRRALGGEVFVRQGELAGHPIATAFGPIKNFSGAPVAVFEIVSDTSAYHDLTRRSLIWLALATGCALLLAGAIAFWLGRGMAKPIQALEVAMGEIASGKHQIAIPGANRRDEIGSMAKAVEVFKEGLVETGRLRQAQEQQQAVHQTERRNAMQQLAERFEAGVGGVVELVSSASTELRGTADSMAGTSEESERRLLKVTAASAQAKANAQAVATAVEELDASINEIGRRVNESAEVAGQAAGQAERTNEQVKGLADAAQKIGDVVTLISSIAAQTNLLALNATIEAARAGDSGRGFAVVASEVKALASQTSKATEEISSQVNAIQVATQSSVAAIADITSTIGKVNEIASAIATAVSQQGAATREIAHNVAESARSTDEVSANIIGVSQAAQETGVAASQVVNAAGELSRSGETMRAQVDAFLREVRAA